LSSPPREQRDVEVRRGDGAVGHRLGVRLADDDRVVAVLVGAGARELVALPELQEALRPVDRYAVARR